MRSAAEKYLDPDEEFLEGNISLADTLNNSR
jgi:hypothetical protein